MKLLSFFVFPYKTLVYSCVYKTLDKEWGEAKSTWNLSFKAGVWVGKKTYLSVTVSHVYKWIERHPSCCAVRTILSVTISANSWSCHQSTQSLNGFHRIQLKGYFAFTVFFSFNFFPFLTFYSIDLIRNWNFHDHQVLWMWMGSQLLRHVNTLKKKNKNPT